MSALLAVQGLELAYGKIAAVKGIDLAVGEGQVVCLIGANGSGKTTTLRGLSGLLKPKGGRIVFAGTDITGLAPHRIARLGLVQVPEGRQIFASMSVEENLRMGGFLVAEPDRRQRLAEVMDLFPRLAERRAQVAGLLSGGEQQMLAMGRAMIAGPRLLLLDEPSMGLSPIMVEQIFTIIDGLKRQGMTILLVEQNARLALDIADHAYVIETGRIRLSGPAEAVARDEAVLHAYLGGE
jgi:branched-chain amino acid transport system ATP-binding protein